MHEFVYKVNGIDYPVIVTYKKIKKIYYRFSDGAFKVSCPRNVNDITIKKGLDKFALSLIKRSEVNQPEGNDYMYIFGVKVLISESGQIPFSTGEIISYSSRVDLNKKLKKFFLTYLKVRVEHFSKMMNVPLYKVRVRDMKTRFGSNSKKAKSLTFAYQLIYYEHNTIDSVVVHELAHILVYNHSKKFYDVVYKYCPNYDIYRKKLIRKDYQ